MTAEPVLSSGRRTAIVLFNLGGPDEPGAVRPFLNNLFADPLILRIPSFVRRPLAWWIAKKRAPFARKIYAQMGGRSPILPETYAQALALEKALGRNRGKLRVFCCMRYWHPRAADVVKEVARFAPDHILLLPLYPQFSTTTTLSSLREWDEESAAAGLSVPTTAFCCYPEAPGLLAAYAETILEAYFEASGGGPTRILFSAHGLPERIALSGDPYAAHVKRSVEAIVAILRLDPLDYVICYQSRVGPLAWLKPSTDHEIVRAGKEGKNLVVVPIAFVSEHSETLVELDIEYRHLAEKHGVKRYLRVPAPGTHHAFIDALATLCRRATRGESVIAPAERCPPEATECYCRNARRNPEPVAEEAA